MSRAVPPNAVFLRVTVVGVASRPDDFSSLRPIFIALDSFEPLVLRCLTGPFFDLELRLSSVKPGRDLRMTIVFFNQTFESA